MNKSKSIHASTPHAKRPVKDLKSFHNNVQTDRDSDDSGISLFLSQDTKVPEPIAIMISKWIEEVLGKGKGQGKDKGKIGPRGSSSNDDYSYSPKLSPKLVQLLQNPCFIIEDENIYKLHDDQKLEKLSLTRSNSCSDCLDELVVLREIIGSIISRIKSEKVKAKKESTKKKDKEEEVDIKKKKSTKKKKKMDILKIVSDEDSDES